MRMIALAGWVLATCGTLATAEGENFDAANRALLKKLDKPVAVELKNAPLKHVLKFIRVATREANDNGVPIYVDPAALGKAGVDINTLLTIVARKDEPLKESLARGLASLRLGFKVEGGLLKIVEAEAPPRRGRKDLIPRSAATARSMPNSRAQWNSSWNGCHLRMC